MSAESVRIVRELLEGFSRRDNALAFEHYHPEIVWDASRLTEMMPDQAGVYYGHEGVRAYWRSWLTAWRQLEFDVDEILDGGDDVVALISNQRQWGRHSGIVTELPPYGLVFTFRGDKVVRWCTYPDQEEALRAAGIAE